MDRAGASDAKIQTDQGPAAGVTPVPHAIDASSTIAEVGQNRNTAKASNLDDSVLDRNIPQQGRPDSALIWATYLQNWCVELHDSCSGFWSQTKVLGAAIVFCTLHNTSKYVCLSHVINSQY